MTEENIEETPVTDMPSAFQDVTVSGRKISVKFERKVSDGDYGSVTASAWVENVLPFDVPEADVPFALGSLLNSAAITVFDQLGIDYHLDEEAGVLREDVRPVTEGRVAQAFEGGFGSGQFKPKNDDAPQGVIKIANAGKGASGDPLPQWVIDKCNEKGITSVFDNTLTRDAARNQPYYKEAVAPGGVGHGKDGKAFGFYPN